MRRATGSVSIRAAEYVYRHSRLNGFAAAARFIGCGATRRTRKTGRKKRRRPTALQRGYELGYGALKAGRAVAHNQMAGALYGD